MNKLAYRSGMAAAMAVFDLEKIAGGPYSPTKPPRTGFTRANTAPSTVGSNNSTETASMTKTAPPAVAGSSSSSASSSAGGPGGAPSTSATLGGIVPSTGTVPAAAVANATAGGLANQVVATSGGGK